jgi:hypothetical protein
LANARTTKQKTSLEKLQIYFVATFFKYIHRYIDTFINNFFIVFVISLPTKLEIYYIFAILNRPIDDATVSVRKRVIFRPHVKYRFSFNLFGKDSKLNHFIPLQTSL